MQPQGTIEKILNVIEADINPYLALHQGGCEMMIKNTCSAQSANKLKSFYTSVTHLVR